MIARHRTTNGNPRWPNLLLLLILALAVVAASPRRAGASEPGAPFGYQPGRATYLVLP